MQWTLFPCKNQTEINKWEEDVSCPFIHDIPVVSDQGMTWLWDGNNLSDIQITTALWYLCENGVNC